MLYAVKVMPRPRSLTLSTIAAAALAVIDRDGLAMLSMRAVAAELGTGTMSLYRYIADREQLEQLIVDLVLSAVDLALPEGESWTAQITCLLGRVRRTVGAHPAVVPLLLTHRHASSGSRRFAETLLGILTAAGFTGQDRVLAFRTLLSYLLGALQYQHLGPLAGAGTEVLAALPASEFPLLSATARDARQIPADDEHDRGLAAVLAGLSASLASPAGAPAVDS